VSIFGTIRVPRPSIVGCYDYVCTIPQRVTIIIYYIEAKEAEERSNNGCLFMVNLESNYRVL
jgi:hypothetical protein